MYISFVCRKFFWETPGRPKKSPGRPNRGRNSRAYMLSVILTYLAPLAAPPHVTVCFTVRAVLEGPPLAQPGRIRGTGVMNP